MRSVWRHLPGAIGGAVLTIGVAMLTVPAAGLVVAGLLLLALDRRIP